MAVDDVPNNLGGMLDLGANDAMRVTNLKLSKVRSRVWNLSERLQTADARAFDTILAGNTISDDEQPRTLLLDTLDINPMEVQRHQTDQVDRSPVNIILSCIQFKHLFKGKIH